MKQYLSISIAIVLLVGMLQVSSLGLAAHGNFHTSEQIITNQDSAPTALIANPLMSSDWIGEANYAADSYGASVASAGDVNGDGYADIVVGAPYYTNGQSNEGRAYAYYGATSGLSVTANWTFESDLTECELGWNAASAGDVNGDGYDDILVASEYCTSGNPNVDREGRVYLFHGSATGLSTTYNWMKQGGTHEESFGWSVASAGDVNADGYDDVIIGAPWADYPEGHEGRAYVFYGSPTGLALTPNWSAESNIWWSGFGTWVDSAGDVNNDGFSDVIIGHPGWSSPEDAEGRAYIYLGSATGLALTYAWTFENNYANSELGNAVAGVGDVNGDGYDDVMVGGGKYANPDPYEGVAYFFLGSATGPSLIPTWSLEGNQAYAQFGWRISPAGDVNKDGFYDVLIGAPWATQGQEAEGMAFLYFGSPDGNLSKVVYSKGADQAQATLGWAVSSAGDVNGDGNDDILLGARNYDGGQDNEGRAFVYHGMLDPVARLFLARVIR